MIILGAGLVGAVLGAAVGFVVAAVFMQGKLQEAKAEAFHEGIMAAEGVEGIPRHHLRHAPEGP